VTSIALRSRDKPGHPRRSGDSGRTNARAVRELERKPAGARPQVRGPQRERHEPDYLLLFGVVALVAVGILMVYSSSGVASLLDRQNAFAEVGPQAMWAVLGAIVMVAVMRMDYRYLRLISVPAFLVSLVLLVLVILPDIGPIQSVEGGGSSRWLKLGPLPTMHPAEIAKLALVIYLAHWLAKKGRSAGSLVHGLIPFLLITGPVLGLVILEPDLGTTGVLTLTAFTMFFIAGGSLIQLSLLVPVGLATVALVVSSFGYMKDRVDAFIDPFAYAQGIGFHTVQGLLALGAGGMTGIGLGESRQPGQLHLPAAETDYVFAVLGQEIGFFGAIAVIGLYLLFAYRGIRIALGAPDTFGALLAVGITAWLTIQAFINIGVVVALLPVTGITLPFISSGGSSLVVSLAAVGILLSISRETLPRGNFNDADSDRRRWHRRARVPGTGGRQVPARARS
jgi:cell division protein FtsW